MNKVLILGSWGNLGTQLVKSFEAKYQVIALDRGDLNFLDFDELKNVVKKYHPDVIINAVAYNNVDACEENQTDLELAFKLNKDLPGVLAKIADEISAVLVHFSSDYVFGGDIDKQFFSEDDEPCPIQKYGETKLAGENEILKVDKDSENFKYYIIRTSKLFGPKGSSEFAKPSFFDIMLKLSAEKSEISVVDEELSCFTYTLDLANATKNLLNNHYDYGVYHIVNEGAVSWYNGVCELFRLKGINVKVKAVNSSKFSRPASRPAFSALNNNKFPKLRHYSLALKDYFKG